MGWGCFLPSMSVCHQGLSRLPREAHRACPQLGKAFLCVMGGGFLSEGGHEGQGIQHLLALGMRPVPPQSSAWTSPL